MENTVYQELANHKKLSETGRTGGRPLCRTTDGRVVYGLRHLPGTMPNGALVLTDKTVQLNHHRCIGCGLCVSTCPNRVLRLFRKPRTQQRQVPANMVTALLRTAWKRKKIGPFRVAAEIGKSQRDRYLPARRSKIDALEKE